MGQALLKRVGLLLGTLLLVSALAFVAFSVIPFNLLSRSITSLITLLVYKKLSGPIKKLIQE